MPIARLICSNVSQKVKDQGAWEEKHS